MNWKRCQWYYYRFRAMSPLEWLLHVRRKWRRWSDRHGGPEPAEGLELGSQGFPVPPPAFEAGEEISRGLRNEARQICGGQWRAFGHLALTVDRPPRWQMDYLAGVDLESSRSAFELNHRVLPGGADIKLIWEWSRWVQLVRIAQGAYVLGDPELGGVVRRWLGDWVVRNPPYRGWNWTSALEAGIRLIQFAWIDALLRGGEDAAGDGGAELAPGLEVLKRQILPAHAGFVWRDRSFGSSANNHLIGELSGLIVAVARWRNLERYAARLRRLRRLLEREVLAQFAEDGGNREQALHYHLFSLEFCLQAAAALQAADEEFSEPVRERLERAQDFFVAVHGTGAGWDYGDSDDAVVTPFWLSESGATEEWYRWLRRRGEWTGPRYWLGSARRARRGEPAEGKLTGEVDEGTWTVFHHSGIAVARCGSWGLRWDLSPLGYLATAAHGHLDALHLSIWLEGAALVIDPGTGAYYADDSLRSWLASWDAHNGPHPVECAWPRRLGSFLWSGPHARPRIRPLGGFGLEGELAFPSGVATRRVERIPEMDGWKVTDHFGSGRGPDALRFLVRWQLAPECAIEELGPRRYGIRAGSARVQVTLGEGWESARVRGVEGEAASGMSGLVSPRFRVTTRAPYLELSGFGGRGECTTLFVRAAGLG